MSLVLLVRLSGDHWRIFWPVATNYKLKTDASILKSDDNVANRETGESPVLREEVEKVVRMLKDGKSPDVDNIPADILKHGGLGIIDALTVMCQKI